MSVPHLQRKWLPDNSLRAAHPLAGRPTNCAGSRRSCRIESPNAEVESHRKSHPKHIGDENVRRCCLDLMEYGDGRDNGKPKANNVQKRKTRSTHAKKSHRPKPVQYKLKDIDRESQRGTVEACLPPYEPAGHGDRDVKNQPNRPEKPVRRTP